MNEATLKGQLVKTCERHMAGAVVLRHEEIFTAGYPDMTVTWRGKTVWLEAKYVVPRFRSRGLQEDTCKRLASQGVCYYVLYEDRGKGKRTKIVHPSCIQKYKDDTEDAQYFETEGFDHNFVANFVRQIINGTWEWGFVGATGGFLRRNHDYHGS